MEVENLDVNDDLSPYKILLKVFLNCPEFDYGIIFFTRYLIYEFISENETKFYSKDIKIGNLLPQKYIVEMDGTFKFLFEDFYKELMSMGECNEKINVFITPYVFRCNLNILIYNNPEDKIIKVYKCGKYTDIEIHLLLRVNHYDIYYIISFYNEFYRELDILIDNKIKPSVSQIPNNDIKIRTVKTYSEQNKNIISQSKNNNKKRGSNFTVKEKDSKFSQIINNSNRKLELPKCFNCKNIYEHKENVFGYCNKCLKMELKTKILQGYFEYLQRGYTKNCKEKLKNFITNIKFSISMKYNISLDTAINNSGFTFDYLFMEIKQNLCLFCGMSKDNNKYYLELPCKCKICQKKCFDQYMKNIEEMNRIVLIDGKEDQICIIPMTECPCGYIYNLDSFLKLIFEMEKLKEKSYIKVYEETIKNNWKWLCMVCRQNFNRKNKYYRLIMSDNKIDKNILKSKELKHLICQKCAIENKVDKFDNGVGKINCQFCNSEHQIEYIKKVDSDNKTESACILI